MMIDIPADAADRFRRHGWLHVPAAIEPTTIDELRAECERFEAWARNDGPGLHHFEQTANGPALARSEELIGSSAPVAELCARIGTPAGVVLGEPAVLFKEKINFKHPGGGGFAPHQDATAYRFVDHHVSCMVPLDPATVDNGCLEVASGHDRGHLPTDDRGCIDDAIADELDWRPIECQPGDVLLFDSYTPHRSGTNRSDRPRRAFYLTYNAATLGDHRDRYYADKREEFDRRGGDIDGERVRVSITGDFLGRPVGEGLDDLLASYRSRRADPVYNK